MKAFKFSSLIIILLLILSAPLKAEGLPSNMRVGYNQEGVKIVLETKESPDFQYYFKENPPSLIIELFDAQELKNIKYSAQSNDQLFSGLIIKDKNFWIKEVNLPLGYWVPQENCKIYTLQSPNRLVIEIKRDYKFAYSWPLAPNLNWENLEQNTKRGYIKYSILTLTPDPQSKLDIALANDDLKSREKTSAITMRVGALAGTNGGFFASSGGPLGLVYKDPKVLFPPVATRPPRTALGITEDNKLLFDRIKTDGNKLVALSGADWTQVKQALGGGPRLIENGAIHLTTDEEELGKNGNDITRPASRTAIGVKANGDIVWLTAMGYTQARDDGITLDELAQFLLDQNVVDAMAFDGGHSTTMAIQGKVVGKGRGDTLPEPKVGTALVLKSFIMLTAAQRIELEKEVKDLTANGIDATNITVSVRDALGSSLPDGTPVLFSSDLGSIPEQVLITNGKATARLTSSRKTGKATVTVRCGIASLPIGIYFLPEKPAKFFTRVTETTPAGNYMVQLLLTDKNCNPLAKTVIEVKKLTGKGNPSHSVLETDKNGLAEFEWEKGSPADQFELKTGRLELTGKITPGTFELKESSGG